MIYLKLYESFVQKSNQERREVDQEFRNKLKSIDKKYLDELLEYMHEFSDIFSFTQKEFDAQDGYFFAFPVEADQIEQLRENFHQGIFDRIVEDYPGTEISFRIGYQFKDGMSPTGFGSGFNDPKNVKNADEIPENIERMFKLYLDKDGVCIIDYALIHIYIG